MAEAVGVALSVAKLVIAALEGVSVNKSTCACLQARWARLQDSLERLRRANSRDLSARLGELQATQDLGRETLEFIQAFTRTRFLGQVYNYQAHRQRFKELGERLDRLIQELQLGVALDTQDFLVELNRRFDNDTRLHASEMRRMQENLASGQVAADKKLDALVAAVEKLDDLQRLQSIKTTLVQEDMLARQTRILDDIQTLKRIVSRSRSRSASRGRSPGRGRRAERDASDGVSTCGSTPWRRSHDA
jgi:uncharacterized protein (DUF885 family)